MACLLFVSACFKKNLLSTHYLFIINNPFSLAYIPNPQTFLHNNNQTYHTTFFLATRNIGENVQLQDHGAKNKRNVKEPVSVTPTCKYL